MKLRLKLGKRFTYLLICITIFQTAFLQDPLGQTIATDINVKDSLLFDDYFIHPKEDYPSENKSALASPTSDMRILLNYYIGGEMMAGAFYRSDFESYFQHVGYYNISASLNSFNNYDVMITLFGSPISTLSNTDAEIIKDYLSNGGGLIVSYSYPNQGLIDLQKIDPSLTFDNKIHRYGNGFILPHNIYTGLAIAGSFKEPLFSEFLAAVNSVGSRRIGNRTNQVKTYYGEDINITTNEIEITCEKTRANLYETLDLPNFIGCMQRQSNFLNIDLNRRIYVKIRPLALEFGLFANGATDAYDRVAFCFVPGNCIGIFSHECGHIFEYEHKRLYFHMPSFGVGIIQSVGEDANYDFGWVIQGDGKFCDKRGIWLWYALIDLVGTQNMNKFFSSLNSHKKEFIPPESYWNSIYSYPEVNTDYFSQAINIINYYMSFAFNTNYTQQIYNWGYTEIKDWRPVKQKIDIAESVFNGIPSPTASQIDVRNSMWESFYKGLFEEASAKAVLLSESIVIIKLSLNSNSNIIPLKEVILQNEGKIGNLHLEKFPTNTMDGLSMPTIENSINSSRTFTFTKDLYNDDVHIGTFSTTFEFPNFNYLKGELVAQILNNDSNLNDNAISEPIEIWAADFKYKEDNYSFTNWSATLEELGELSNIVTRENLARSILIPSENILKILSEISSTGGHCYGMASTSILYKNNPSWLSIGGKPVFELAKTTPVIENIKYAFYQQSLDVVWIKAFNEFFKSEVEIHKEQFDNITTNLSQNYLLVANYSKHATVLHTIIKKGDHYELFEYNNNWLEGFPNNRGQFITKDNKLVFQVGDTDTEKHEDLLFNVPRFTLPNNLKLENESPKGISNGIIDSVIGAEVDSLRFKNLRALVYIDDSYKNGFTSSNAEISNVKGIVRTYDFVSYKVFYFNREFENELTINAKRSGNFSLYTFTPAEENNGVAVYRNGYENIYVPSDKSIVKISHPFSQGISSYKIDFDNNGVYDLSYAPDNLSITLTEENKPPSMSKYFPLLSFSNDMQKYSFNLQDYFIDDNFENLVFSLIFDNNLLNATIKGNTMELTALKSFSSTSIVTLTVKDGQYNLTFPIQIKNSATGINDLSVSSDLKVYPNPASESVVIEFPNDDQESYKVRIIDSSGGVVRVLPEEIKVSKVFLERRGLPSGVYLIEFNGRRTYRGRLVYK